MSQVDIFVTRILKKSYEGQYGGISRKLFVETDDSVTSFLIVSELSKTIVTLLIFIFGQSEGESESRFESSNCLRIA